jgi:hypothetical protein
VSCAFWKRQFANDRHKRASKTPHFVESQKEVTWVQFQVGPPHTTSQWQSLFTSSATALSTSDQLGGC